MTSTNNTFCFKIPDQVSFNSHEIFVTFIIIRVYHVFVAKFRPLKLTIFVYISKESLCKLNAVHKDHIKEFGIKFI